MPFTFGSPMEFTRIGKFVVTSVRSLWITQSMTTQGFFSQHFEIATLNSAVRADKASIDDFVTDSKRLENLSTLGALQRTDTHLGHHLQHTFGHGLAIG